MLRPPRPARHTKATVQGRVAPCEALETKFKAGPLGLQFRRPCFTCLTVICVSGQAVTAEATGGQIIAVTTRVEGMKRGSDIGVVSRFCILVKSYVPWRCSIFAHHPASETYANGADSMCSKNASWRRILAPKSERQMHFRCDLFHIDDRKSGDYRLLPPPRG